MLVRKTDKNKVLYGKIISITEKYGLETDLKIDGRVYDIEFELFELLNAGAAPCLAVDCLGCTCTDAECGMKE